MRTIEMVSQHEHVERRELDKSLQTKFQKHDAFRLLAKGTNATQLVFEMRRNRMTLVVLHDIHLKRAQSQAVKVQASKLPLQYQANARLFYCCFQSSKGENAWNDNQNSYELTRFLQSRCPRMRADIRLAMNNYFGGKIEVYSNSKKNWYPGTIAKVKSDESMTVEYVIDNVTYFKVVFERDGVVRRRKEAVDHKQTKQQKITPPKANATGYVYKGRAVYKGPKGGLYYVTSSGNKVYVSTEDVNAWLATKQKPQSSGSKEVNKQKSGGHNATGYNYKGRAIYKGAKGGLYYETPSGYKVYVTTEELNAWLKTTKKKQKSSASKGRQYYRGTRGGIYYETSSGNKVYLKPEQMKKLGLS
eukprot:1146568_1